MKANSMKAHVTLGKGCAISNEMFYTPSFLDELDENLEHTRMFVFNATTPPHWFHHEILNATIVATCLRPRSERAERACYSLSNKGAVEIFNSQETIEDAIFKPTDETVISVEMTDISFIGEHAYACGSANTIYKSTPLGWTLISFDLQALALKKLNDAISEINKSPDPLETDPARLLSATKNLSEYTLLQCIDGLVESSIYTCGSNGVIWYWNGLKWTRIKSGTKQHLHDIHCVSEELVIMCGHNGTVLKGNNISGFKRLATGSSNVNFWAARFFEDTVYLGSSQGLFIVSENQIIPCPLPLHTPSSFSVQNIDTIDQTLWVVADKFILRNYANKWEFFEHPDNY